MSIGLNGDADWVQTGKTIEFEVDASGYASSDNVAFTAAVYDASGRLMSGAVTTSEYSVSSSDYSRTLTVTAPKTAGDYRLVVTFTQEDDAGVKTEIGQRALPFKAVDPVELSVKLSNNQKTTYMYQKWEEYGYLDYLPYTDWLNEKADAGEITEEERQAVATVGRTAEEDSETVSAYVQEFTEECEAQGYTVVRLDAVMATPTRIASGGSQSLFAYQNTPLLVRLFNFFTGIL